MILTSQSSVSLFVGTGGAGNKSPVVDNLKCCSLHRLWPYLTNGRRYAMSGSMELGVASLDLTEHAIGMGRARFQFTKKKKTYDATRCCQRFL